MSVSYSLSERVNAQVVIWAVAGAVYKGTCAVGKAYQAIRTALPHLLFALIVLTKALGLVAIIAGTMATIALIPPTFWLGLLISGVFAWVTFPRLTRK